MVLWDKERTNAYRVLVGSMREKGYLQDLVVDVRAILKCISEREVYRRAWTEFLLLKADTSGVLL